MAYRLIALTALAALYVAVCLALLVRLRAVWSAPF